MPADSRSGDDDPGAPEDVFDLLGDETRVRIVQELGRAWTDDWPGEVGYVDLMDRVGAEDSGRFNYHLSKLVGSFVSKREDGYKLNFPGLRIYRSMVAGTFDPVVEREGFPVDGACHDCGGHLEAAYRHTLVSIACADCDARYFEGPFPPRGASERSDDALVRAADRRTRHQLAQFRAGVCPWCGSRPSVSVETPETSDLASWAGTPYDVHVVYRCDECGGLQGSSVGKAVLDHPAVVSFFHVHGVDLSTVPSWDLAFAVTDRHTDVRSRNPWRFRVTVPCGDETLRLVVEDDLSVADSERVE